MSLITAEYANILEQARLVNYATPFFYTSRDILKKNYHTFTHLFDDVEIYYALKANSDPKILAYLNSLGCGFEAASAYEIEILIDLGVEASNIVYGTSIKPAEHIKLAYQAGVKRFAADSKEEIKKIADNAPGAKVFIRTIVDDGGSVFVMSERFGAPVNTVKDLILYARHLGLKTYGISFYVGSQAAHANMWAKGVLTVKPVIEELLQEGITLEVLNIGGGFPVHYDNHQDAPELREIVINTHNALHTLPYIPRIIMEPGRGIVATSTVLVTQVIARNDRADKPWLCLDAGIYNALYEAMIHQGATRYPVHPLNPPTEPTDSLSFTLAGPTGDSLDIIARDVVLPSYIDVGDKLVFEHAGAYTIALATRFNGFPAPSLYIG
ncbi:MAG TPA: type III PLP-dependent enzyme [Candidatus Dormibacteraeota bacterium]|nr:type III PLP-dependent enzyme [Candidatus Dormibacteraeota bacterium]